MAAQNDPVILAKLISATARRRAAVEGLDLADVAIALAADLFARIELSGDRTRGQIIEALTLQIRVEYENLKLMEPHR